MITSNCTRLRRPVQSAQCAQLSRVISRLAEDHDVQLKARDIVVHQQLDKDLFLDQSESIVQMVVSNLLRNAIEHTQYCGSWHTCDDRL
jgi:signal transduction histidine kinase